MLISLNSLVLFFGWLVSSYYIYWLKCLGFVSSIHSGLSHVPRVLSEVPLPELARVREWAWKGCGWNWCWDGARGWMP